ncbi:response regulator transcription factor [Dyella mobilis]|uniref:Response regulator transcription factor n=1 Tax=Dyella mobilis TaxID=1849582 RepID=A0ABS2KLB0_9GAMM|nr:response regulator transcription factor [Dyella mobilis]MBM7131198.1 response regulator transcription factor [Dyella mobilis]GLQ98867.1 DNA-binding response regulator [Dyella mobilis]
MDNRIRIVLADDHPVIRLGIEATLDDIPSVRLIGSAVDSTQLVSLLDAHPCDVLVTDYAMPGGRYGDGLELVSYLRDRYPELQIIIITSMDKTVLIRSLLACGVDAILSKADDMVHLRSAVQAVHSKRKYFSPRITQLMKSAPFTNSSRLSPRELEVIKLYVGGTSINGIAERLQRSKQTISTQKVSAMRKLGIDNDADLFKYATELGLAQQA